MREASPPGRPGLRWRRERVTDPRRMRVALVVAAVLVALAVPVLVLRPHETRIEREVRRLNEAMQRGDAASIAPLFGSADGEPAIVHRAAERLAPLGDLRQVRDVTPAHAAPGTRELLVRFSGGDARERLVFATDGKIKSFGVVPAGAP